MYMIRDRNDVNILALLLFLCRVYSLDVIGPFLDNKKNARMQIHYSTAAAGGYIRHNLLPAKPTCRSYLGFPRRLFHLVTFCYYVRHIITIIY